jgi:hypothetical protein
LTFAAVDQAALYGLLGRLRDAGLELVAAARIPDPVSPSSDAPTMPTDVVPIACQGDVE